MFETLKILTGPTASGKSEVALQMARQGGGTAGRLKGGICLRRTGTEIISADSMQIYRGMDVGTAKPSLEVRREVPHHLIDIVDPWEAYNVGQYVQEVTRVIADLEARGREPLIVGGTALYLKALTEGLFSGPGADWGIRQELETVAVEKGVDYLHGILTGVDPVSARRIQKGDLRRVVRALEVYKKTGRPISAWQQEWGVRGAGGGFDNSEIRNPDSEFCMVILSLDRKELYRRIEERVERMFEEGLVEEVRRLLSHPPGLGRQAREALGYAEVIEYLEGRLTLEGAKELVKKNTRHFAKRQMTWFRGFVRAGWAKWLEVKEGDRPGEVAERATGLLFRD
jgi:tRNA dimethylallyltransferase